MRTETMRWITALGAAALVVAACGSPEPVITEPDPISPFQDELDAEVVIDIEIVGEGEINRDVEVLRPGRPINLLAVPDLGSQFVSWSGAASSTDPHLLLTPDADVSLTATFEPIPPIGPEFTINVDGEGWVSRTSGPVEEGEINLRAIPANGWEFVGWSGMVENPVNPGEQPTNPINLPTTQPNEITAIFRAVGGGTPVINVWGGDVQRFDIGTPQRWINVRGNVSDNGQLASLSYSLNEAPNVPLTIGPDRRRLQDPGDFNLELDTDALPLGRSEVVFTAVDTEGNVGTARVAIDFTGNEWPLPYQTNWGAAGAVEDQAQVVDGIWTVSDQGIRTAQLGYDRIVAIGDVSWTDYEAAFTLKIHEPDNRGYDATSEPFVGFVMRWTGHSAEEDDVAPPQPLWYYWPAGSLGGYYLALDGTSQVRIESNESIMEQADNDYRMDIGETYNVKIRVETGTTGEDHRVKVWPLGADEPREWTASVAPDKNDVGPAGGSLLLIAHYFDVTFGDITVVPID